MSGRLRFRFIDNTAEACVGVAWCGRQKACSRHSAALGPITAARLNPSKGRGKMRASFRSIYLPQYPTVGILEKSSRLHNAIGLRKTSGNSALSGRICRVKVLRNIQTAVDYMLGTLSHAMFRGRVILMSSKQATVAIIATFVVLLAIAAILNPPSTPTLEQRQQEIETAIEAYLEKGHFALPETWSQDIANTYLQNCLVLASEKYGKRFDGIRVNERIDAASINIFFINDDPDSLFADFRNNCVSIGHKNIVLCDLQFVKELQAPEFTSPSSEVDGDVAAIFRQARLRQQTLAWLWVVGHEIGHIAFGHTGRHFHFQGDKSHELIVEAQGVYSHQEKEADDFAIEAVGTDALGRLMYQGIHQFVNSEGTRIANDLAIGKSWQQLEAIPIRQTSKTHPPLFYRAARFNLAIINHFVADPKQLKLPGLENYDGKIYLIESPEYYEGIMKRVRFQGINNE